MRGGHTHIGRWSTIAGSICIQPKEMKGKTLVGKGRKKGEWCESSSGVLPQTEVETPPPPPFF
jgi:hypothetical protein